MEGSSFNNSKVIVMYAFFNLIHFLRYLNFNFLFLKSSSLLFLCKSKVYATPWLLRETTITSSYFCHSTRGTWTWLLFSLKKAFRKEKRKFANHHGKTCLDHFLGIGFCEIWETSNYLGMWKFLCAFQFSSVVFFFFLIKKIFSCFV